MRVALSETRFALTVLTLLCLVVVNDVRAAACAPTNLITQPDSPFRQIPVMDQDGAPLCSAYAAAQLMNYQLVRQGLRPSVDPLFIGPEELRASGNGTFAGSQADQIIKHTLASGNCPRARVSAALREFVRKSNATEETIIGLITFTLMRLSETGGNRPGPHAPREIQQALTSVATDLEGFCSPGTRLDRIFPELENLLSALPAANVISTIFGPYCQTVERLAIPNPTSFRVATPESVAPELSNRLRDGQGPVSVGFCARVLSEPDYRGIDWEKMRVNSSCTIAHEALIVGARPVGQSCEFLLRNSWGTGFGHSTENWKCLCRHRRSGAFVDDCTHATHNDGNYVVEGCWINAEALARNTYRLTSIGP